MVKKEIEVLLPAGLHILNVTKLKALVDQTESTVFLTHNGKTANVGDPISLLNLSVKYKETVTILCDGIDEINTIALVKSFLENK